MYLLYYVECPTNLLFVPCYCTTIDQVLEDVNALLGCVEEGAENHLISITPTPFSEEELDQLDWIQGRYYPDPVWLAEVEHASQ